MTNRITDYLDPPHPLDRPEFADRHRVLKFLCGGLMVAMTLVTLLVIAVVRFALGARPLPGNAGLVAGVPILTVLAAVITLTVPLIATIVVPIIRASGIRKVATTPPAPPEPGAPDENDADRLWKVYSAGKFVEYALAEGAVLATAILFHVTSDWTMMGFIAAMVLFMLVRFPTTARARTWFDEALPEMDRIRQSEPPPSE
jgi:heme/copper-type cytochrome/quinol oxidase subunit 2